MIEDKPFSQIESMFINLSLLLLCFFYFYNLGIYPLFQEEPRRGIIALEMLINDNLWVPTQTGDLYFRKPPLFNWLIIIAYKIFGDHSEFAVRFFSVLSQLGVGLITYLFSRKYIGHQIALLGAFGYLISGDVLLAASMLGEIDLFYTFITAASLFLIYDLGDKKRYFLLFQVLYILTAIGLLTKGLSSLPYTAISLLVYFIVKRQFLMLLNWSHFAGILTFVVISAGYFYMYSMYEDPQLWWDTLLSESSDKAAGGGIKKFINHLWKYPLLAFSNLLPPGLFLLLLFRKEAFKTLKVNPFIWYAFLVFIFNFIVYWVSVEGRTRYIYPIFPFIILAGSYLAIKSSWKFATKFFNVIVWLGLAIFTLGISGVFFIDQFNVVDNLLLLVVILLSTGGVFWYLSIKNLVRPVLILYGLMVMAKLTFSSIITQTRQKDTGAAEDKDLAYEMAEITGDEPIYRYNNVRISFTIVYYLEAEKWQILNNREDMIEGYYIAYDDDLDAFGEHTKIRKFYYQNRIPIYLIRNMID